MYTSPYSHKGAGLSAFQTPNELRKCPIGLNGRPVNTYTNGNLHGMLMEASRIGERNDETVGSARSIGRAL